MKKCLLLLCVLCLVLSTGCSRRYMVTLQNGNQITAYGKPKLEDGAYVFKDGKGEERRIPRARVKEIAPVSQASSPYSTGKTSTFK
ncbi:MAG TPA: YgdI/YgdR family lipoprotein [Verrucomicrobiota bacterium]|nr:YgdI/YgdR family lipoprotein [Verrucomicrobiota bacterium]